MRDFDKSVHWIRDAQQPLMAACITLSDIDQNLVPPGFAQGANNQIGGETLSDAVQGKR
nr:MULTISPECIES: hypothetical protein [unclassified Ruegeria]